MITVEFKDFEDMKAFAQQLLGMEDKPEPAIGAPVTAALTAQATPAGYVSTAAPSPVPTVQPVPPAAAPMPAASQPTPAPVPTSTQSYTQDDLARAAMTLMDAGRQMELLQLLKEFGVESLPALPAAQYGAFATRLRAMGAQI